MISQKGPFGLLVLSVILLEACLPMASAFQVNLPFSTSYHTTQTSTPNRQSPVLSSQGRGGFGAKKSEVGKSASSPAGDFAYQEMLVYFNSMQKDGVTSKTMDPNKRLELEGLVRKVLTNKNGIRMQDIGQALLPKSEWKLMFSTSEAVLESLPNDATVFLNILDEQNLDYILKFSKKTLGLDSLTAKCKYTFDVSFPCLDVHL